MIHCHVSRQIDDHIHGEMVADAFHQALSNRIAELTKINADYYPFSTENIGEALGSLSKEQEKVLKFCLESGQENIGGMIANWITQYWDLIAEKKAIREFSE